jgi:hypothetical protein
LLSVVEDTHSLLYPHDDDGDRLLSPFSFLLPSHDGAVMALNARARRGRYNAPGVDAKIVVMGNTGMSNRLALRVRRVI